MTGQHSTRQQQKLTDKTDKPQGFQYVTGCVYSRTLHQSQTQVNWERCDRKGIWHKTGGLGRGLCRQLFLTWLGTLLKRNGRCQWQFLSPATTKSGNMASKNKDMRSPTWHDADSHRNYIASLNNPTPVPVPWLAEYKLYVSDVDSPRLTWIKGH